jgi:NAD(P)-dependent dehydrogenase (short-subunit alcohol dehydrogenase family)
VKTALVTGSSRGIGRGIADLLAENGYAVIYSGTKAERPECLSAGADYFPCDISDATRRRAIIAHVVEAYGRLDVLVNNAGVAPLVRRDLLEMEEESFDRVMAVNLKGTLFMCQLAANAMLAARKSLADYAPRIINIGSISAYTSSVFRGEYCISKAGVGMVTKLFADRLAREGIPVFEVRPGIVETDMTQAVHEKYQQLIEGGLLPVPRMGKPSDVARVVLACCSGNLDYSAGQVLDADGGFALRRL